MHKVLITYSTHEGQTAKISDVIAEVLRGRGLDVTVLDVKESPGTIAAEYTGVIVGGSIHMGKHDKHIVEFVQKNLETLKGLPSAFFSVSVSAHADAEEAERYAEQFEEQTGWRPARVALFGGALLYTQYNFVLRRVMKKIMQGQAGDTDVSRDYVYTEWDGVRAFAEDFARDLESTPA